MTAFLASNGMVVRPNHGTGALAVVEKHETDLPGALFGRLEIGADVVQALREFLQQERDERLGRWRHPEHPGYVAYPRIGGVLVVREFDGHVDNFEEGDLEPSSWIPMRVAHAYREAHPAPAPPKSWQDANPGDVWVFEIEGEELIIGHAVQRPFGVEIVLPVSGDPINLESSAITGGRRIWPEPEPANSNYMAARRGDA